jgi:transposase
LKKSCQPESKRRWQVAHFILGGTGRLYDSAAVFIEFLKRLTAGAKKPVYLIVYRGPAHIAKKTKAFVETLGGMLKLFYIPPYSPGRSHDELVWKHLKADTIGRMVTTSKADFKTKVVASMRSLQKRPEKNPYLQPKTFP